MTRFLSYALSCICAFFVSSAVYADSSAIARELHIALNSVERESAPGQLASQLIQMRAEYRVKEQEIRRLVLEVLDSKEYEDIHVRKQRFRLAAGVAHSTPMAYFAQP